MSRIVVLGGGESGVGSAVLAKVKGFDVFLSDMGNISEEYRSVLQEWNIPFEQGKHSEDLIMNADEVIVSSSGSLCLAAEIIDGKPVGGKAPELLKALQDEVLREFMEETN
jgi:branched-subunit amino acid aminotransferase/4-amino-4-deoxychorismate lyase